MLTAYHVGVQVIWDAITPEVRPEDAADLMAINSLALRYLQLVTPAVAAGYLEERQTIFGDEHSVRHTLLATLLEGQPADNAAGQAGLRLPPCYFVLAIWVGPHPDERAKGVDAAVAARRKLRRMRLELERHVREPVLSALSLDGGTALLPSATVADQLSAADWDRLCVINTAMGRAAGADVTAAAAAEPSAVAGSAKVWPARSSMSRAARASRLGCTGWTTSCWSTSCPGPAWRAIGWPHCSSRWRGTQSC